MNQFPPSYNEPVLEYHNYNPIEYANEQYKSTDPIDSSEQSEKYFDENYSQIIRPNNRDQQTRVETLIFILLFTIY